MTSPRGLSGQERIYSLQKRGLTAGTAASEVLGVRQESRNLYPIACLCKDCKAPKCDALSLSKRVHGVLLRGAEMARSKSALYERLKADRTSLSSSSR